MEYDNNEQNENVTYSSQDISGAEVFDNKKNNTVGKVVLGTVLGFFGGLIVAVVVGIIFINSVGLIGVGGSSDANDVVESLSDGSKSSTGKLTYMISLIKNYYYEDVDNQTLVDGIYSGLVDSLGDPYSTYFSAEEFEDFQESLTGDYAGIGAVLSKNAETNEVTIIKVYADTPAEKSDLRAGDIILYADEYSGAELDLDQFVQHIRGEAGTDVTLKIRRDDEEFEVTCTRAEVITPSVAGEMISDDVGYIEISQFRTNTSKEFIETYESLEKQGMKKVIFDLRSNGGGLVDSVTEILDYLLPEGTVVYTLDKNGNREDYNSTNEHYVDIPMVVLVDGNTASAAEIFTGAIRDFEYGTIIGTKTFGKGIVQTTYPITDGSAIKITTQSYYTPSGECIHGIGITPDIELEYEFEGPEDEGYSIKYDNQINKGLEVLK